MKKFTFRLQRTYRSYEDYEVLVESENDLMEAIASHNLDSNDGDGEGEREMIDWEASDIQEITND